MTGFKSIILLFVFSLSHLAFVFLFILCFFFLNLLDNLGILKRLYHHCWLLAMPLHFFSDYSIAGVDKLWSM